MGLRSGVNSGKDRSKQPKPNGGGGGKSLPKGNGKVRAVKKSPVQRQPKVYRLGCEDLLPNDKRELHPHCKGEHGCSGNHWKISRITKEAQNAGIIKSSDTFSTQRGSFKMACIQRCRQVQDAHRAEHFRDHREFYTTAVSPTRGGICGSRHVVEGSQHDVIHQARANSCSAHSSDIKD